jgi:hypothetical protein
MNPTQTNQLPRQSPEGDTFHPGVRRNRRVDPAARSRATGSTLARRPPRPGSASHPDLLEASGRLQPRDQVLAQLLDEHQTLTTTQITTVLFASRTSATNRLYTLRRVGWVDRFIPIRANGRLDTHWVLGPLGAHWAAHHDGRTPPTAKAARQRREAIAASSHLEHTDGTNDVFVRLVAHARTHPETRLARWWSPARSAAACGRRMYPDGHGVWEGPDQTGHHSQVGFWLEYDTGTETLERVTAKIEPYRRLRRDGGPDYPLLIWLPTPTRESNLHRRLNGEAAHLGLTVATTTATATDTHPQGITGPIWKVAGNGRKRQHLIELPARAGRAGPYHPGPPTAVDDPLHLLRLGSN